MGDVVVKQSLAVKHFSYLDDVTVGVVSVIVDANVAVADAGEVGEASDVGGRVTRDITETVAFAGYYLNGV